MVFKFYILVHYKKPGNHAICTFSIALIFLFTEICQIQILTSKVKRGSNFSVLTV